MIYQVTIPESQGDVHTQQQALNAILLNFDRSKFLGQQINPAFNLEYLWQITCNIQTLCFILIKFNATVISETTE